MVGSSGRTREGSRVRGPCFERHGPVNRSPQSLSLPPFRGPGKHNGCMLFERRLQDGLRDGSIRLAFRRWRRPQVVAGRRYRSPIGMVLVERVSLVSREVPEVDAHAAGMPPAPSSCASSRERRTGRSIDSSFVATRRRIRAPFWRRMLPWTTSNSEGCRQGWRDSTRPRAGPGRWRRSGRSRRSLVDAPAISPKSLAGASCGHSSSRCAS